MKHLNILLISTFIVGFFTGAYVFLMSRVPETSPLPSERTETGFEILGDTYGGCELRGCASYRLLEEGSYDFIQYQRDGDEKEFNDVLSKNQIEVLTRLLEETDLGKLEETEYKGECPVAYDGIAYRFAIFYEGQDYDVDTCVQDVESSGLIQKLTDYFEIFRLTHLD